MTDVTVSHQGSIFLFQPLSETAKDWIAEHVAEPCTWFGHALVVEHRYASDLVEAMQIHGLELAARN